ncbi:hypothetical protein K445DRAFT_130105 [Daldinia sp. EC12]|nr:hypothetical protein F4774DRAFT_346245 [Daldinia eschscholtzii]OTB14927.1 hypothetical protein K445DRAFT_130105 [Daldinia sp. EC12]
MSLIFRTISSSSLLYAGCDGTLAILPYSITPPVSASVDGWAPSKVLPVCQYSWRDVGIMDPRMVRDSFCRFHIMIL